MNLPASIRSARSTASVASAVCRSEPQDSTMDAVIPDLSTSASSHLGAMLDATCNLVEPEINFELHDLFYLTVQYVPVKGEPHLLYQKYLKVPKRSGNPADPPPQTSPEMKIPLDKLVTTIDVKIYRSSNKELVGSLSKSIELPGALPSLMIKGLTRSVETAGASRIFSITNIMKERLVQEANSAVAGIPGFHSVFFGVHQVHPGGRFQLVSRRVQPISNSSVLDLFAHGVISTDHRSESWPQPNQLRLEFLAPTLGKRKDSLGGRNYLK